MICGQCGREISKSRRFCSRTCYYASRTGSEGVVKACKHCGRQFRSKPSAKRKFCSRACYWNQDHTSGGAPCQRCGYDRRPVLLVWDREWLCPNCWAESYHEMTGRAPGLGTLMPALQDAFENQ